MNKQFGSDAEFRLRAAMEGDQPTIGRLVRGARLNPLGLHWHRFLVAVDAGGSILACGQVKEHGDGSRELASLVVREHWRGRGVGSALVRELMAGAEPPLWLMCRWELIPYYERFGFRRARAEEALPAYFRWVRRLMKLISWVLPAGRRGAIMVHGGGESG